MQRALYAGLVPGLQREFQDLKDLGIEELFVRVPLPIRDGSHIPEHETNVVKGIRTPFIMKDWSTSGFKTI